MNIYIFNPVTTLNLLETPVGAIAIQKIHTSSMSFDPALHRMRRQRYGLYSCI